MPLELEGPTGEGDVVIGGKQSDQAKCEAATGLGETEPVDAEGADATPTIRVMR